MRTATIGLTGAVVGTLLTVLVLGPGLPYDTTFTEDGVLDVGNGEVVGRSSEVPSSGTITTAECH